MERITVSFGEFEIGERITVVMNSYPCGSTYMYEGTIVGKRECRGKDYLIMEGEDGYLYDVSMSDTEYIISHGSNPHVQNQNQSQYRRVESNISSSSIKKKY